MIKKLQQIFTYGQGIAGLRKTDVILSSFPRSGSTWVRFFLCNLISLTEWGGIQVDFRIMNETMVALGRNNLVMPWQISCMPRIVKTHQPYKRVLGDILAIGIVRDPRDVMVSYYHFEKFRKGNFKGVFSEFIRTKKYGIDNWFNHYRSWINRWDLVVRYEDLRTDSFSEFSRILKLIDSKFPQGIIHEAINRSGVNEVRKLEVSGDLSSTVEEARFVRSGKSNQWRNYFNSDDEQYFEQLRDRNKVQL